MKFTIKKRVLNDEWERWFAWFPVNITSEPDRNVYAWLETVERQALLVQPIVVYRYREVA